jgi:hypothetical protein
MTEEKKEEKDQEKKIIIDEDWKSQAQKEKEILAAKEAEEKKAKQKEEREKRKHPMPPANFTGLVSLLVTQTLFALGAIGEKDETEKREPDLDLARYNIDLLGMLEEKTKGNLSKEEEELLKNALHQMRMTFVELSGQK